MSILGALGGLQAPPKVLPSGSFLQQYLLGSSIDMVHFHSVESYIFMPCPFGVTWYFVTTTVDTSTRSKRLGYVNLAKKHRGQKHRD